MADLPAYPDSSDEINPTMRLAGESKASTPRWVYVLGIIAIILAKLVVVLTVSGTIGPGLH